MPVGANTLAALGTRRPGNTSSMASSGRNAPMLATLPAAINMHQPAEGSMRQAASVTSNSSSGSTSSPPNSDAVVKEKSPARYRASTDTWSSVPRSSDSAAPAVSVSRTRSTASNNARRFPSLVVGRFNLCAIQGRPRRCAAANSHQQDAARRGQQNQPIGLASGSPSKNWPWFS